VLSLFVYTINCFYLLTFNEDLGKARLINDYAFITFILLGQDISLIHNFIFFITPLVNSSNHSGKQSNLFFFFVVFAASLMVITFFYGDINELGDLIIPIGGVYVISVITSSRKGSEDKLGTQFSQIENNLNKLLYFPKSYQIYSEILDEIHKLKYFNLDFSFYEGIACFSLKKIGSVHLVNSSSFIYEYDKIEKNNLNELNLDTEKTEYLEDFSVTFNDVKYPNSLVIKVKSKKVYLFILKNKAKDVSIQNLYIFNLLKPIFERLIRIIEFEQSFNRQKRKNIVDIKSKFLYIRNAETVMHFIKNKLSPLYNLLAVWDDLLNEKKILSYDKGLHDYVSRENVKSHNSVKKIINQANLILDKNKNPFNFSQLNPYKIDKVITVVSNLAEEFLQDDYNVDFNLDFMKIDTYQLKFNEEGFYVLITDWFANMKKYGTNNQVYYNEEKDDFLLIFVNTFDEKEASDVTKLVREFNNNKRNEIIRRKSHGLFQIKTSLEQMGLVGEMMLSPKKELHFEIKFKKYEC
jgi:hypothetical protein